MPVRRVASFEEAVKRLGTKRGISHLFRKSVLLVEQESTGVDLSKAKRQALQCIPGQSDADLPRYLLVSDFRTTEPHDLKEGDLTAFAWRTSATVSSSSAS